MSKLFAAAGGVLLIGTTLVLLFTALFSGQMASYSGGVCVPGTATSTASISTKTTASSSEGVSCYPASGNGVTGAYALAGSPLPAAGNAIDFWSLYQHRPGWLEVPSATAAPSQRGLPMPGDIMVWYDPPPRVGHVAIVVGVIPPVQGHNGSITFAEANGPGSIVTQTLLPDLTVVTWSNPIPYSVLGYIRPTLSNGTGTHP